jgi:AcrR family transcriptional regulator
MPVKDCQTEKLILDTAMKIFFAEGRIYATTQEIADAAGVTRTLINYYFRSKKSLLEKAVRTTRKEFKKDADTILGSELPFREKTGQFIEDFLKKQYKYPYLESFITAELIKQRLKKSGASGFREKQPVPVKQYLKEIENEMRKGVIPETNPAHFMINMFSLMVYPVIMKPLQMSLYNLNEKEYNEILNERKRVILNILLPFVIK